MDMLEGELSAASTNAADARLEEELAAARAEVAQLRIRILGQRDHEIGCEAQVGRIRADLQALRERFKRVRDDRDRLRERVRELEEQVEAMRSSNTWRVGRVVTKPLGRVRGRG